MDFLTKLKLFFINLIRLKNIYLKFIMFLLLVFLSYEIISFHEISKLLGFKIKIEFIDSYILIALNINTL